MSQAECAPSTGAGTTISGNLAGNAAQSPGKIGGNSRRQLLAGLALLPAAMVLPAVAATLPDPAVAAWQVWRDAKLAYAAHDSEDGYEDICRAEDALCLATPNSLAGAAAQLRCVLTFVADDHGWVRNMAVGMEKDGDAAERAMAGLDARVLANVIDFLETRV